MPRSEIIFRYTILGLFVALLGGIVSLSRRPGKSLSGPTSGMRHFAGSGMAAPDFSLHAIRGGTVHLADLRGRVVLVSFLSTQNAISFATPDRSRSQIVFLKSMENQYGPQGMRILIVDATNLATGQVPDETSLINFTYDWDLENIPILEDVDGNTARSYGITQVPSTFLISSDGRIAERWDGFVTAPQLAFAMQAAVDGSPVAASGHSHCALTAGQAPFAGMPMARPLSDRIWVVDGGAPWSRAHPVPLHWVVLGSEPDVHLRVVAKSLIDDGGGYRSQVLLDDALDKLPAAEARSLLSASMGKHFDQAVFLKSGSVSLSEWPEAGCLQLQAVVTRKGSNAIVLTGQANVPIEQAGWTSTPHGAS